MNIKIEVKTVSGRSFRVIRSHKGFYLAQEVIEVAPKFEPPHHTLSKSYYLLTEQCVLAQSSNREFSDISSALELFKAA